MRINLFIAAALIFSVNAANFDGQDFKENVVNCFNNISATSKEFTSFAHAIHSFEASHGYDRLHYLEQNIESHLNSALNSCCIPPKEAITDQEGAAGVIVISDYTTSSAFALFVAQSQQDKFDSDPPNAAHFHTDLVSLSTKNDALFTCLKHLSPPGNLADAATLNVTLSDAYVSAKKSFSHIHHI